MLVTRIFLIVPYAIALATAPAARAQTVNRLERLPDFVSLVKSAGPAVVHISTKRTIRAEASGFGMPDLAPDDPVAELPPRRVGRFLPASAASDPKNHPAPMALTG